MKKIFFSSLFLTVLTTLYAAEVKFPNIEGYALDEKIERYDTRSLFTLINGAADVYLNYGFVEMFHAVYRDTETEGYIVAEAYRHKNADYAYGMYVMERTGSTDFINIGAQGYVESGVLNASGGEWYIKLYSHQKDETTAAAMKTIATGLENELFPDATIPAEIAWLPAKNRVENSDLFVPKEVLGHPFLSEAYTSSYDKGSYELFVFKKESAEELATMIASYCEWAKSDFPDNIGMLITIADRYNGTVYLLAKKNYAAMTIGIEDMEKALTYLNKLLEQVP